MGSFIIMDKRLFLALVLTAIVIIMTPLLFPGAKRPVVPVIPAVSDSSQHSPTATVTRSDSVATLVTGAPTETASNTVPILITAPVETTIVNATRTTYAFSSNGAAPISVVLADYSSRRRDTGPHRVELVNPGSALARYHLAFDGDTIALDTVPLRAERGLVGNAPTLRFDGTVAGKALTFTYTFAPDSYLVHVVGMVANAPAGSVLLIDLPMTLRSNEPDSVDDQSHLAVSFRDTSGEVRSTGFGKLEPSETVVEPGPHSWVATRNKYFLVAYRAENSSFSGLRLQGLARQGKTAANMAARTSIPLGAEGSAAFNNYAGPQSFRRLQRLGSNMDQVNPYGGFFQGAVQPFATIVMRALLWMKDTTQLNYGWVLVLFGIIIRLVLWPLNQSAMRTSIKMQRLQPELQAIQKKYSDDPKRQQETIMKVYKDHGMSPLSPLMGCLPMLLPMPILFALYFVFQNTIEFRGVPFLWLPDISLKDPYYITPLLMGVSMFVMTWIGMRNSPPNPQAKMMLYMMPVMMTVLFLNFASGLNLYYAVQNIAALPQQWLLARERMTAGSSASDISSPVKQRT